MWPDKALDDIRGALSRRDLWIYLGWFDISQRYRRSVLGPWWITLSTSFFVVSLAVLWSNIFNLSLANYMPFFAVAHITWGFISSMISESSNGFIQFDYIIRQLKIPYSSFILRVLFRNVVVLAHNAVIIVVVLLAFRESVDVQPLQLLLGLCNLLAFLFFLGIVLATMCLRFRDLQQLVANIMTALFFITPIVWRPESVTGRLSLLVSLNPIAWYIGNIRDSILLVDNPSSFFPALTITAGSALLALLVLQKNKAKIPYWL